MKNNDAQPEQMDSICCRCHAVIQPDDKMFLITASLNNQPRIISSLCFPCASAVLTEAVISQNIVVPRTEQEVPENAVDNSAATDTKRSDNIVQSGTIASTDLFCEINGCKPKAALGFQVSEDGFCLSLQCNDEDSYATSEHFTWSRIAQLLIAANPDLFGDINEPTHWCFVDALVSLGFNVPGWPKEHNYNDNPNR